MSFEQFTDQQSRYARAFTNSATIRIVTCEACDRTYFVTSPGHGDYAEGELENLRTYAEKNADKYIEVSDIDSVAFAWIGGKQIVIGCLCDPTKRHTDWIEAHAEQLTEYLSDYWTAKKEQAKYDKKTAERQLETLAKGTPQ